MKGRLLWSSILIFVGLVAMLIGAIDPLEGSLVILPGSVVVALGAFLGKSPHRRLLTWSFALVAIGVGALWVSSAVGGFGGNSGHSMWWALVLLPYPAGWIMGLVGTIGKGRHGVLVYWTFILMAIGVGSLFVLGKFLGPGAMRGRSMWVLLAILPYLTGLTIGLVGAVLQLIESFKNPTQ
jgi:hypothetical protein